MQCLMPLWELQRRGAGWMHALVVPTELPCVMRVQVWVAAALQNVCMSAMGCHSQVTGVPRLVPWEQFLVTAEKSAIFVWLNVQLYACAYILHAILTRALLYAMTGAFTRLLVERRGFRTSFHYNIICSFPLTINMPKCHN